MPESSGDQILKTREDPEPIYLQRETPADGAQQRFSVTAGSRCSWAKPGAPLAPEELRPRIEPWLTALVQAEHLALLAGSGLTHAIHRLATGSDLPGMRTAEFGEMHGRIDLEAARIAEAAGRERGNLEDQLRVANDLLRGLEIIAGSTEDGSTERAAADELRSSIDSVMRAFAGSILAGERSISTADPQRREEAFSYLVSFLTSFGSRSGTRERLRLFTTNYDRLIEAGADVAGLRLVDRFVGSLVPVFRASRLEIDFHYDPPGVRGEPRYLEGVARFAKLHGSVDWVDHSGAIRRFALPFGAEEPDQYLSGLGADGSAARQLIIYPNSAKDRETAFYPYVELFRDFAAAICRPNTVLLCYGYSFGDEHINRVIEDMLTLPSAHLVVISHSDPLGRIMRMYEKLGRAAQTSLLIGDHLGDLAALVEYYLPKPAIDRTTFRMAELLRARWGPGTSTPMATEVEEEPTPAPDSATKLQ